MNRSKSIRIRRSSKVTKQLSNNNILLFKLFDPIVQSAIIIFFIYCLDAEVQQPSYRLVLRLVVVWQLTSSFLNFFLRDPKLLVKERIAFVFAMVFYLIMFFFVERSIKESYIGINEKDANIPVHQALLMAGLVILTFWYNVTCYREIKSLLGGVNRNA